MCMYVCIYIYIYVCMYQMCINSGPQDAVETTLCKMERIDNNNNIYLL